MDDINRQLFALVRKIRLNLYQALKEWHAIDPTYEEYSPNNDADGPERRLDIFTTIQAIKNAEGTAEAKKYSLDHRRYRLEWKGYRAAKWTVIVVCIYTSVTLYMAYHSKRSADAARIAADAAKSAADTSVKQLELTQRPWVFVKEAKVISPLIFDKNGAHVTFKITVHNSGLSPAANVLVIPKLYPLPLVEPSGSPIEGLCNATSYTSSNAGLLVFPNTDGPPQPLTFGLGEMEVQENTRHGILVVTPFICVLYRPTFRKEGPGYSSGIQYFLWPTIWPDKTSEIPANRLPLNRNVFFGEEAQ